jgi:hypothetical protein
MTMNAAAHVCICIKPRSWEDILKLVAFVEGRVRWLSWRTPPRRGQNILAQGNAWELRHETDEP